MRFRKLRIAWSVVWGVVATLLVALWVRSYTWLDYYNYGLASFWGQLFIRRRLTLMPMPGKPAFSLPANAKVAGSSFLVDQVIVGALPGGLAIPYWVLVLICAVVAVAPWQHQLRQYFGRRSPPIASTK